MSQSHQRRLANMRERKRMLLINKGFDLLKSKLPVELLMSTAAKRQLDAKLEQCNQLRSCRKFRLTKVDILRLTINYIKQLDEMRISDNAMFIWPTRGLDDTPKAIQSFDKQEEESQRREKNQKRGRRRKSRSHLRESEEDEEREEAGETEALQSGPSQTAFFYWETKKYYLSCSMRGPTEEQGMLKEILWIPPSQA